MARLAVAGQSDIGRRRLQNQDHFLIARLRKSMVIEQTNIDHDQHAKFWSDVEGHLLMVADGMGGHSGGDVASQLAIDAAATYVLNALSWFFQLSRDCEADVLVELKRVLEHCQQEMVKRASKQSELHAMGTTLTLAYVLGSSLYVAHVGDSRCYLCRSGRLQRLTRDHTWGQTMIDQGFLSESEAARSPMSHVLWNAVGELEAVRSIRT